MTRPAVEEFALARLNWALLRWTSCAGLVTIGSTSQDDEAWTLGSLRIALLKLSVTGHWNAAAEVPPAGATIQRVIYCELPQRVLASVTSLAAPALDLSGRLARATQDLRRRHDGTGSVYAVATLDWEDIAWAIVAAAAVNTDVHLHVEATP